MHLKISIIALGLESSLFLLSEVVVRVVCLDVGLLVSYLINVYQKYEMWYTRQSFFIFLSITVWLNCVLMQFRLCVCPEYYTELFPNLGKVIGERCLGSESLLRA